MKVMPSTALGRLRDTQTWPHKRRIKGVRQRTPCVANSVRCTTLYLQTTLKLSWNTVNVPSALKLRCRFSCTRKLFPGP